MTLGASVVFVLHFARCARGRRPREERGRSCADGAELEATNGEARSAGASA